MDRELTFAAIADERRNLADILAELSDAQWSTPSLCAGWTVRDIAAHLVMPLITPVPKFAMAMLRARGNFDAANTALTAGVVGRHGSHLPDVLRRHADSRFTPPGHGPLAPLADAIIHGQDLRRPLGLARESTPERLVAVLDFLTSAAARRGFVPRERDGVGLRWEATDLDWSAGHGRVVRGPAEAVMLLLTGRSIALADVSGEGAELLRRRR